MLQTPIAIHRRPFVAFCCISPSLGSLFAGWVSGEAAEWQAAFNAVMLTVSIAGVLAGISLLWAGHIRYKAEHLELWLQMEETQERVAAYKRPASEDFNNEKPTATMVEDVSVPEIREPKQPC